MTHLTRKKDLASANPKVEGQAIFVDAKQRAILIRRMKRATSVAGVTTAEDYFLAFCAEPSPDALSALAASSALEFSKADQARLASTLALSEGASSIGLRTQSITLMRDAMYRLCEGYANNAIDPLAFQTLQRRFQSSMVAILAIEQLTAAVRPPNISLGGSASIGSPQKVEELTSRTAEALAALRAAEGDAKTKAAAQTAAADAVGKLNKEKADIEARKASPAPTDAARSAALVQEIPDAEKKAAAAQSAVDDAKKLASDKEAVYKAYDAGRQAAATGSSSTGFTVKVEGGTTQGDARKIAAVADRVSDIVKNTLELGFAREFCTSILLAAYSRDPTTVPVAETPLARCAGYITEDAQARLKWATAQETQATACSSLLDAITTKPKMAPNASVAELTKLAASATCASAPSVSSQRPPSPFIMVQ